MLKILGNTYFYTKIKFLFLDPQFFSKTAGFISTVGPLTPTGWSFTCLTVVIIFTEQTNTVIIHVFVF